MHALGKRRLDLLRKLLAQKSLSTQEDLREKLSEQGHPVTQSTISRDLRKLGSIKVIDASGQTGYRLSEEGPPPAKASSLADLVIDIAANGTMIVLHTTPGSASLIARHLDRLRPGGILGTLAGDDTIFVAPASSKRVRNCIKEIEHSFKIIGRV
jgi:transcriptional regulator of arginine metabolism